MVGEWLANGWPMVGQWLAFGWPVVGQWLAYISVLFSPKNQPFYPRSEVERSVLPQGGGRTVCPTPGMLVTANIVADLGRFWQKKYMYEKMNLENLVFFRPDLPKSAKMHTVTNIPGGNRPFYPRSGVEPTVLPSLWGSTVGSTPERGSNGPFHSRDAGYGKHCCRSWPIWAEQIDLGKT